MNPILTAAWVALLVIVGILIITKGGTKNG